MKTKMNPAMGGGASASKKLLAAIAVLAVAFVVFAAIPAVDADVTSGSGSGTGTANTFYVNATSGDDTKNGLSEDNAFKTLSKAIATAVNGDTIVLLSDLNADNEGSNLVTFTQTGLTSCNTKVLKVTKAVTLQSKAGEKFNIPFSLGIDIAAVAGSSGSVGTLTLKDLKISPTDVAYGLMASENIRVDIVVDGCEFTVNPDVEGSTKQVAAIWLYQTTYDTTVKDSKFFVGENKGNQYASAIMIWNGQDITLTGNEATGYARFANIDGSNTVVISGNTGKNMVGPLYIGNDVKGGMFVNIATTQGDATKYTASFTMTGNKISGDSGFIPAQIYPSNTNRTGITNLTADCDLVVKGPLAVNGAMNVNGNITTESEVAGVDPKIAIEANGSVTVPAGKTLSLSEDASMDVDSEGTLTVDGKLVVAGKLEGSVAGAGNVVVQAGANVGNAIFAPETQVGGDSSSMSEMIVGGDSKTEETLFGVDQIITVSKEAGYWNLVKGATIGIAGKLVVPEGTTLTVQAGAELYFLNTATVEIEGTLVIEDGFKNTDGTDVDPGLIYQQGGKVIVSGTAQIAGDYYAEAGQFIAEQDSVVTVEETGTLVSENIVVKASANFKVEGTITDADIESIIYNYGVIIFDSKVAAVNDVTIKMMADGATVVVTNYTTEIGAKATLTIIDDEMVVYTAKDGTKTVVSKANSIVMGVPGDVVDINEAGTNNKNVTISDVTVVEKLTSKNAKSGYGFVSAAGKAFDNRMQISGNASVSTVWSKENSETITPEKYDITMTAGRGITVPAGESGTALAVGLNVVLKNDVIADADDKVLGLTVEGAVDATAKASTSSTDASASFVNGGTITVVNDGSIKTLALLESTVNATLYETGTDKIKNYVTIDSALATVNADGNTVKVLTVLGKQTVNASAAIPANVAVTLKDNNTELIIGAKAGDDVTLTVSKDGSLKGTGKEITVNGTLFAENKLKLTAAPIVSDVMSEEIKEGKLVRDGWILYTNIVAALNGAEDGQTITISKEAGDGNYVTIASDISVKPGVTLVVGNNVAPLFFKNGVTLTVSGTLQTEQVLYAERMFDLKASSIKDSESSAIVVDGTLKAAQTNYGLGKLTVKNGSTVTYQASSVDGAPIAGAYYEIDNYDVVSTLAIAVQNIKDIKSEAITVNGKVSVSDMTFGAADYCKQIVVGNSLTENVNNAWKIKYETLFQATALTLADGAQLAIENVAENRSIGSFTGTVVVGDAAVDFVGVSAESVADTTATSVPFIGESEGKLVLMNKIDASDKGDKIAVSKGTVYMDGKFAVVSINTTAKTNGVFSVATGAVLEPVSKTTITGIIDALFVDGTLNVPSGSIVIVDTLTVNGTVVVAVATSTAAFGTLTVNENIYIGLDASDIEKSSTGAAASVSGSFGFGTAYVADGAVLDDAAVAALSADGVNKLAFNVQGKLWFTVYSTDGASVTVNKAPLSNAILAGWSKTEGGEAIKYDAQVSDHAAGTVRYEFSVDGEIEALYAVVQTYIYNVTVVAEAGIENIAIDGNLLTGNTATVAAGTHNVTYTLKNGYSGTATMTVNGQKQTGLSFSTSGTSDADRTVSIQLSGITASGYVDPTPAPSTDDNKDGLSITDYLLIVLVIVIVIMAVIVAMRLMRS